MLESCVLVLHWGMSLAGLSPPEEEPQAITLNQSISLEVPPEFKVSGTNHDALLESADPPGTVELAYASYFHTQLNPRIGGKVIDGDSPKQLLLALQERDAKRYEKTVRLGPVERIQNRQVNCYYAVMMVKCREKPAIRWSPDDAPAVEMAGDGTAPPPLETYRVYHILLKDASTTRFEYVLLRISDETYKKLSSKVGKLLSSIEYQ